MVNHKELSEKEFGSYCLRGRLSLSIRTYGDNGNLLIRAVSFVGVEELVMRLCILDTDLLTCFCVIGYNWRTIRRKAFSSTLK
jgi:hypothetical protein